jgi:hypothetical protein
MIFPPSGGSQGKQPLSIEEFQSRGWRRHLRNRPGAAIPVLAFSGKAEQAPLEPGGWRNWMKSSNVEEYTQDESKGQNRNLDLTSSLVPARFWLYICYELRPPLSDRSGEC